MEEQYENRKKAHRRAYGAGCRGGADGVRFTEAGTEGSADGMSIGFAGIAAFAVLILTGAGLVAVALQP